nr:MAG TPA: hypothetical protein [Caudoviricetes sp.]
MNVTTYAGHRCRRLFPFCHLRGLPNILYKMYSLSFAQEFML